MSKTEERSSTKLHNSHILIRKSASPFNMLENKTFDRNFNTTDIALTREKRHYMKLCKEFLQNITLAVIGVILAM